MSDVCRWRPRRFLMTCLCNARWLREIQSARDMSPRLSWQLHRVIGVYLVRTDRLSCSVMEYGKERVVALVDMDCFYVQVEQRLNPALKNTPCVVAQYKTWKGGRWVCHTETLFLWSTQLKRTAGRRSVSRSRRSASRSRLSASRSRRSASRSRRSVSRSRPVALSGYSALWDSVEKNQTARPKWSSFCQCPVY